MDYTQGQNYLHPVLVAQSQTAGAPGTGPADITNVLDQPNAQNVQPEMVASDIKNTL